MDTSSIQSISVLMMYLVHSNDLVYSNDLVHFIDVYSHNDRKI